MKNNLQELLKLTQKQALQALNTSEQGLSNSEAKQRLEIFGPNKSVITHKKSLIVESLLRSFNALLGILIFAAITSAFLGNVINAAIIVLIIGLSILLDYFQNYRSLKAVEHLRSQVATLVRILRDKHWMNGASKELVPGDIIYLSAGDLIPADCLLLTAKDLHIQQAMLTGESLPVEKEVFLNGLPTKNIVNIIEVKNVVFAGSSVVSGTATAVVVTTGPNTEFGQIAKSLSIRPPPTEFESGMVRFGLFITKMVMFLILFVFIISIYFKRNLLDSLLFSIALAVGLTPEFLPMITMITLTTGAIRMARKKVIVKNLASIQNLGSIDILCSDKTGTLTTGKMVLERYLDIDGKTKEKLLLLAYLNSLFQSGVENPIDTAILQKTNINPLDLAILKHEHPTVQPYCKVDEIPFDTERRRSSVVVSKNGDHLLISKGAPEQIFKICTYYEQEGQSILIDDAIHHKALSFFQSLSNQGYRTLAIAFKKLTPQPTYHAKDETGLTLAGFLVFTDPLLPDASKVIHSAKQLGVKVKILTGDNELVAQHICEKVGIKPHRILLGTELEAMSNQALGKLAEDTLLFARVSPNQKQRIIVALQSRGHIIGFIGDGINDAPSLHTADVGISVADAVDVAKEASNIILLDHNLKVLLNGILEGRKAFGNVMKYLLMGTSSNFGNMFSMAGAILFLPFLPMLPAQILLNNLLYDMAQIAIPTDYVDSHLIRKPRHWDINIIRHFMFYIGPISSIFDFLTFYVMLTFFSANKALFQTGWFIESLITQILVIFIIRTPGNPFKNRPSLPLVFTICIMIAIGVSLPFSPLSNFFGFVPLSFHYLLFLGIITLVYLLLVQIIKQKLMYQWIK